MFSLVFPARQYGEKISSGLVRIAQLGRINERRTLGKRCRICRLYFNEENQPDIAPRTWIWLLPSHNIEGKMPPLVSFPA